MSWLVWGVIGYFVIRVMLGQFEGGRSIPDGTAPPSFNTAITSRHEIFTVKLVAVEFDHRGPNLFVNGEYTMVEEEEGEEIDTVMGLVNVDAGQEVFSPFAPESEGPLSGAARYADLVTFSRPVTLNAGERGLFRTPLYDTLRGEKIEKILTAIDGLAANRIEQYDQELGDYSLSGDQLDSIILRFLDDPAVQLATEQIEALFFWQEGPVSIHLAFGSFPEGEDEYDEPDEEPIDDIEISINLSADNIDTLYRNIDRMVVNRLLTAYDLPTETYDLVAFDY
jgi:hypothetical protein